MNWFSIDGIVKEIKKIHWPSNKDLLESTVQVIAFTAFFILFFILCQVTISEFLRLLGAIK